LRLLLWHSDLRVTIFGMAAPNFHTLITRGTSFTEEQLDHVLEKIDANGQPLSKVIGNQTYQSPEEALSVLCGHLGVDFIKEIPVNDIPVDLVRDIPINYAKNHQVLPYKDEGHFVWILMTNPLNHDVLDDLRVTSAKKFVRWSQPVNGSQMRSTESTKKAPQLSRA
jgi:general secretion pathway protein E